MLWLWIAYRKAFAKHGFEPVKVVEIFDNFNDLAFEMKSRFLEVGTCVQKMSVMEGERKERKESLKLLQSGESSTVTAEISLEHAMIAIVS